MNIKKIILVVFLAATICGGALGYYRWTEKTKIKPPPVKEEKLAENTVKNYLNALMTRKRDNILPYLTGEAKEQVQKWPAFFGTSNPHLGSFEILSSKKLNETKFEFVVREYQEYTGEGIIGYNDETLLVMKVNDEYLISSIKTSEYIDLKKTANWKTYRNEEYGFEIKYPPESKLKKEMIELSFPFVVDRVEMEFGTEEHIKNYIYITTEEQLKKILDCDYPKPDFVSPPPTKNKVIVENREFCLLTFTESAMGQQYIDHYLFQ